MATADEIRDLTNTQIAGLADATEKAKLTAWMEQWEQKRQQIIAQEGWYFEAQRGSEKLSSAWYNWWTDINRMLADWTAKNSGSLTPPVYDATMLSHQADILTLTLLTGMMKDAVNALFPDVYNSGTGSSGTTRAPVVVIPDTGDTSGLTFIALAIGAIVAVCVVTWMIFQHKEKMNAMGRSFTDGWTTPKAGG